jgi:glycosyltransferase involved in cell wall biosynthesis
VSRGRVIAVVPAHNEEAAIGGVIDEIKAFDRTFDVVVIDDGSVDTTSTVAARHGAAVLSLPYNLGIGGAVQTGFMYALEYGYETAVRLDGDGQHIAAELGTLLEALAAGGVDIVTGSRFAGGEGSFRPPFARRIGIAWFAGLVSLLTRQRVTDTTSGFQALNRQGIELFARDYPGDYPEVEATILVHKHRLRMKEVPVRMREREHGASSITLVRSVYYVFKVTLALCVAMVRKYAVPDEEVKDT